LQNAAQIDVSPYFTLGFSNENEGFMPFCKTPVNNKQGPRRKTTRTKQQKHPNPAEARLRVWNLMFFRLVLVCCLVLVIWCLLFGACYLVLAIWCLLSGYRLPFP
jgi:hypothetical protein